jgi:hypothetical protein
MTGPNRSGPGKRARISASPAAPVAGLTLLCSLVFSTLAAEQTSVPAATSPDEVANVGASCNAGAAAAKPLAADIGPEIVEFEISPFPYRGVIPGEDKPFLDMVRGGRQGHTSPRGSLHWEDESYSDRHTLLYLPKGFDLSRPALIVVFFHGNHVRLMRDVYARQRVPQQLAAARLNAVLVAPQFALDIADSSAGRFWEPGIFKKFLAEAARHLAAIHGDPCEQSKFDAMKVVLVAYSGGYDPAAYALDVGGVNDRVFGVVLLDALYGETDKFDKWIDERGSAFFFSAYSESSRPENLALRHSLAERHVDLSLPKPLRLTEHSVTFLATGPGIPHNDFMTEAWVRNPLTAVLSEIEGFSLLPLQLHLPAVQMPSVKAIPSQRRKLEEPRVIGAGSRSRPPIQEVQPQSPAKPVPPHIASEAAPPT